MSASYRLDGSSRFAPENRWGSFWSVGASWRMNHESFLEDKDWIDDLKIKASFGTQGNDNILNNQPYLDQYQVVNNNGELGLQYVFRGNREITWEKSNNFNAGVEFRFWNRLSGNIEYFNKTTWDLLYYKLLSPSQGTPAGIYENCMRMRNQGVEIELNVDIFNTNDFKWTFGLNATHLKNTLLELPEDKPQDGWVNGNYFMRVGAPLYNYYDYKYVGVDPNTGDALYLADVLDENNNVIGTTTVNSTDRATRYELGKSPIPALYGGFNSYWEYKGFDLNLGFAYQIIEENNNESFFVNGRLAHTDLTFLGIVAISDPVRADVPPAVQSCLNAGIDVKIVTGDTPGTAKEIGRQIGIWKAEDTDRNIITGPAFEALSDEEALDRRARLKSGASGPLDGRRHFRGQGGERHHDYRQLVQQHHPCGDVGTLPVPQHPEVPAVPIDHQRGGLPHRALRLVIRHRVALDHHADAVGEPHHGYVRRRRVGIAATE